MQAAVIQVAPHGNRRRNVNILQDLDVRQGDRNTVGVSYPAVLKDRSQPLKLRALQAIQFFLKRLPFFQRQVQVIDQQVQLIDPLLLCFRIR
ncbi:hypothetical protein D9M70_596760 [compost metagenome]